MNHCLGPLSFPREKMMRRENPLEYQGLLARIVWETDVNVRMIHLLGPPISQEYPLNLSI
jgi:hypothetical protein